MCCCLRNLLGWGQMLPGSVSFLMTPSKQVLMSNLKLDVILLVYKCDLAFVSVMSPCCGGCHIQDGRMPPLMAT
jgi:hypothetical protein